MFTKKTIEDIEVKNKAVLLRVDFNVPLSKDGEVRDDTRIRAALPTINYLTENKAKVIIVSHLGRPKGIFDPAVKLDPVARSLSRLLKRKVIKVDQTVSEKVKEIVSKSSFGDIILLENIRFNPGETKNDPDFAKNLAELADIFVNDAFGTAHRAHASTVGVTKYLPSVAGFCLVKEVINLSRLLENPARPFCVILGGNKVSDKIGVIKRFMEIVDCILLGGGMCFTFLKAKGYNIGKSICQDDYLDEAKKLLKKVENNNVDLYLPEDVVAADSISESASFKVFSVTEIPSDWYGLDIGPKTTELFKKIIKKAQTAFWNGPMGVFELEPFSHGTEGICQALADLKGVTIVGGGDSDAALRKFDLEDKVSFVSTGGGACLRFLEGSELPGLEALDDK